MEVPDRRNADQLNPDLLICNTAGTLFSVLLTQLFLLVTGKRRRKNVWKFCYDYTD